MTGPAKIGHVGTNYTLPCNISYLSTGIEYIHSVTCMLQPTTFVISAENCMAKQYWNTKFEKVTKFYVPTCPIFAGLVTYMHAYFMQVILL